MQAETSNPQQEGKPTRKRGRPALPAREKKRNKVGGFWFTDDELRQFEKLLAESRMESQTDFVRQILFEGKLELYYTDEYSKKIYAKLHEYRSDLRKIEQNCKQAVEVLNAVHKDHSKAIEEAVKLVELANEISAEFKKIIALFNEYKALVFPRKSGGMEKSSFDHPNHQ